MEIKKKLKEPLENLSHLKKIEDLFKKFDCQTIFEIKLNIIKIICDLFAEKFKGKYYIEINNDSKIIYIVFKNNKKLKKFYLKNYKYFIKKSKTIFRIHFEKTKYFNENIKYNKNIYYTNEVKKWTLKKQQKRF